MRYNIGLAIAGWLAFFLYAAVVEFAMAREPRQGEPVEITIFTILAQGIGYLLVMGAANVCYCLGMIAENIAQPVDRDEFRRRFYGMGFWFSFALPFAVPALVLISVFGSF